MTEFQKKSAAQDCRSKITNWNYFQHLRDLLEKENELNLLVIACCTNCRAIWLHCRIKVSTVLCIFSMAFMCCIVDCLAFSSSLPFSYISKATSWIVTGQTRKYFGVLKWKPLWTPVYCAKCLLLEAQHRCKEMKPGNEDILKLDFTYFKS